MQPPRFPGMEDVIQGAQGIFLLCRYGGLCLFPSCLQHFLVWSGGAGIHCVLSHLSK